VLYGKRLFKGIRGKLETLQVPRKQSNQPQRLAACHAPERQKHDKQAAACAIPHAPKDDREASEAALQKIAPCDLFLRATIHIGCESSGEAGRTRTQRSRRRHQQQPLQLIEGRDGVLMQTHQGPAHPPQLLVIAGEPLAPFHVSRQQGAEMAAPTLCPAQDHGRVAGTVRLRAVAAGAAAAGLQPVHRAFHHFVQGQRLLLLFGIIRRQTVQLLSLLAERLGLGRPGSGNSNRGRRKRKGRVRPPHHYSPEIAEKVYPDLELSQRSCRLRQPWTGSTIYVNTP
jgi:hypothetical protein